MTNVAHPKPLVILQISNLTTIHSREIGIRPLSPLGLDSVRNKQSRKPKCKTNSAVQGSRSYDKRV